MPDPDAVNSIIFISRLYIINTFSNNIMETLNNPPITLAQIGCGYWGPNLLRNFSSLPNVQVKYLVDLDAGRRVFVGKNFPKTQAIDNLDIVWDDEDIDAVIIATPAASHFALGMKALECGKHIFVEKPIATKVSEVDQLVQQGQARKRVVMAGHTFIFNSAVRYVKKLIDNGELGDVRYIYSQRLNLGRIRSDIDALWNFAPHDISIIQYWLGDPKPLAVSRSGMDYIQSGIDDVVFLNIIYPNQIMANVHVSWLDPHKIRKMVVVGSSKMVVYDDISDDKIIIYDKGIDRCATLGNNMDYDKPGAIRFDYRTGDILMPKISWVEPLHVEAEHFLECICTGREPITGLSHARQVVDILERAQSARYL